MIILKGYVGRGARRNLVYPVGCVLPTDTRQWWGFRFRTKMGTFYTNITIHAPEKNDPEGLLRCLAPSLYIFKQAHDPVVFDARCKEQNTEEPATLTEHLSRKLHSITFAVPNRDDSVLWFRLYQTSKLLAQYAGTGGPGTDVGGLCRASDRPEAWMRTWWTLARPYAFETNRHAGPVRILGMLDVAVGFGFDYLRRGEALAGMSGKASGSFYRPVPCLRRGVFLRQERRM